MGDDDEYVQYVSSDSPRLTEEAMRQLWSQDQPLVHPNPDHPTRVAARQGFSPIPANQPRLGTPHSRIKDPRELRHVLTRFMGNGVVVFTSGYRYTYAAMGVVQTGRWYITGAGQFYGKNEFDFDEFIHDVLMRDEVTSIWASDRFDQVFGT